MRILITNNRLAKRTGTELYVFELALELLARGHQPAVFTPQAGALAERLRSRTVPVVDRLAALKATPEIIHGHHREPLLLASMRFPQVPAVFVCHSWNSPDDLPLKLPNLVRFVAVDEACRDRLIYEGGIPADATQLVCNFANTQRFRPRGPLPSRPKRALLFTNRAAIGSFPRASPKGRHDGASSSTHFGRSPADSAKRPNTSCRTTTSFSPGARRPSRHSPSATR